MSSAAEAVSRGRLVGLTEQHVGSLEERPPLTPRQSTVLQLIASGLSSAEIAVALGISEKTVEVHCASLLRKLSSRNRAQAVDVAHRWGLLG